MPGFSGLPIFLTGISLGGCLTINVMRRNVSRLLLGCSCWRGICVFATYSAQVHALCYCQSEALGSRLARGFVQAELFQGAVMLAPMVSLEKVSHAGLNPYLLCVPLRNTSTVFPDSARVYILGSDTLQCSPKTGCLHADDVLHMPQAFFEARQLGVPGGAGRQGAQEPAVPGAAAGVGRGPSQFPG